MSDLTRRRLFGLAGALAAGALLAACGPGDDRCHDDNGDDECDEDTRRRLGRTPTPVGGHGGATSHRPTVGQADRNAPARRRTPPARRAGGSVSIRKRR